MQIFGIDENGKKTQLNSLISFKGILKFCSKTWSLIRLLHLRSIIVLKDVVYNLKVSIC